MGKKRVIVFIIVAMVIAGLGVYHQSKEEEPLIEEESVDYEAPIIEELHWKPTRVVNDKVYDGALSFREKKTIKITF